MDLDINVERWGERLRSGVSQSVAMAHSEHWSVTKTCCLHLVHWKWKSHPGVVLVTYRLERATKAEAKVKADVICGPNHMSDNHLDTIDGVPSVTVLPFCQVRSWMWITMCQNSSKTHICSCPPKVESPLWSVSIHPHSLTALSHADPTGVSFNSQITLYRLPIFAWKTGLSLVIFSSRKF